YAVDWWSLGIVIFEMHTGSSPFAGEVANSVYVFGCFDIFRFIDALNNVIFVFVACSSTFGCCLASLCFALMSLMALTQHEVEIMASILEKEVEYPPQATSAMKSVR